MQSDDVTRQAGGSKPRKLTLAREKLRALGDTSLARAGGGMEEVATTTQICEFIFKAITEKVVSDIVSAGVSAVTGEVRNSYNASCPSVNAGEGPAPITLGCPTAVTCAATCFTCVNPPLTAPLASQTTCPGYGCLPAVPAAP